MTTKCPYCDSNPKLVDGSVIYPHRPDLAYKHFWLCQQCSAYVGCHPNSKKPLGRLANAELRKYKSMAHAAFDPSWKEGWMSRSDAYSWLAAQLSIDKSECHIGMFDIDMCKRVLEVCHAP